MTEQEAIKALEEIQQYREIGFTPKMVREMIKSEQEATHYALIHDVMLKQYEEIGTPDECQIAMIKYQQSKPEKPEITSKFYMCKKCGRVRSIRQKHAFCEECGCEFDWCEKPDMRSE